MGRSVSVPNNAVAAFRFWLAPDEEDEFSLYDSMEDYEGMVDTIIETVMTRWSSFTKEEKWLDREDRALLVNSFARIGVSYYCGLICVWLVSREDEYKEYYWSAEDVAMANLCKGFCGSISGAFLNGEKFFV